MQVEMRDQTTAFRRSHGQAEAIACHIGPCSWERSTCVAAAVYSQLACEVSVLLTAPELQSKRRKQVAMTHG